MTPAARFEKSSGKNNPLYHKMRDRFSCEGNLTIGELMRNRVQYEAMEAQPVAKPAAAPRRKQAAAKGTDCAKKPRRRQITAVSCTLLLCCAIIVLVSLISNYTGLSINASSADEPSDVSGQVVPSQEEPQADPAPVAGRSSFDNVLNALNQSFGE